MKKLPPESALAWVEKHFPDYKTRRNGKELVINNPFDGDDGHHFNINLDRLACHDWRGDSWAGYDQHGKPYARTFLRFVQLYLNCSWADAIRSVTGGDARRYLPVRQWQQAEQPLVVPEPLMQLPEGARPLLEGEPDTLQRLLLKWLRSRGVDREQVRQHQLHYLGSSVVWPYYEYEELVYWQSRGRLNKRFQFPAKTEAGVGKESYLYGFDLVEPASFVIIHEAIFDAMTIGEQSVATGGAVLSDTQVKKLRALGPRDGVILAPDNDQAGTKSLVQNGLLLQRHGFKPLLYSRAPELGYELEGEARTTKDWNEVAQYVTGFGRPVRDLFERQLRVLNQRELVKLTVGSIK